MPTTARRLALLPLLFLALASVIVIGANAAKTKHPEAGNLRARYHNGACEGTEVYFSPPRGTLLILCGIPQSRQWGGLIYRVAENYGHELLGDGAYEVTVFSASRRYWDSVLVRDDYLALALFPDLERQVRDRFGR